MGRILDDAKRLRKSLGHIPEPVVRPSLLVVSGLPGSGKSYFCQQLALRTPFALLESEALRHVLFSVPQYTSGESFRLFRAIRWVIDELLRQGVPVILDSTNLSEHHRERLYHIADSTGARLVLVRVEAPDDIMRQRLEDRTRGAGLDKSKAGINVYSRMKPSVDVIRRQHIAVDTSRDIRPALDKVLRAISRD
ncbi:MAG: ATP-binding protein [Chloroflexi bacterium]|nr:ATP-binding protein [Chloroflexota bacterium]